MNETNVAEIAKEKLNQETSKIAWQELQRFFASGTAVWVAGSLDLVEVAYQFSIDNQTQVAIWLKNQQVALVADHQARAWLAADTPVWAVVVKPWLLVQETTATAHHAKP